MDKNNRFTIIGCGHSESLLHYNNNALVSNSDGTLLIDCGHTAKHALHDLALTIGDIDEIFITHVHGDHVFGLERFAYETRFKYQKRIKLHYHPDIYHELWEQTLKGSLSKIGEGSLAFDDYFELCPLTGPSFVSCGNHYDVFEVAHTPGKKTLGLCVNDKIFYSSDTIAIPEILSELSFEVGFHDVTLSDWNPVHATLASLIDYPEAIRKKLYLMSYEDSWPMFEQQVNAYFSGFAKQGMSVEF